ncbi:putative lipase [Xylariaceae sp. FL0804]|nr:putative lipase [Xylariaceae sp. FL0804]
MPRVTYVAIALALLVAWLSPWLAHDADESSLPLPSGADPEPTVERSRLEEALSCPKLVEGAARNVVLLVHGTGSTPEVNWQYTLVPPLIARGYQPCLLAIPGRLTGDAQTSAEYVAHAVHALSNRSASASAGSTVSASAAPQVSIVAWSAGALVTQWTLLFYPSTRALVRQHVALAPDYRGSWVMLPLVYLDLFTPAFVQQLPRSRLVAALRRFGGHRALVPTTNVGSATDQIVQPGFWGSWWSSSRDSWRLIGGDDGGSAAVAVSNVDLFKTCAAKRLRGGRLPRLYLHETLLWDPASHRVIFDALENRDSGVGSAASIRAEDCAGGVAPGLREEWTEWHGRVMPMLAEYASTVPVSGWPEVPLREYAVPVQGREEGM